MKKIKEGLSKIAIKNSGYSLISVLLYKFGGLIFTILIARLLLPELFGIYSLVLSISAIFITFTNLGVDETFLRYASSSLGNKNYKKLRGYFRYLLKIKINLLIVGILIFLLIAKFLSYNVYNNPLLFYPLIFSSLFIIIESLRGFIGKLFLATKNLKPMPFLEFTHQIARISLSLLAILILSSNFKVAGLFLAFSLAGIIIILQVLWILYKENKAFFIGKTESINKKRAKSPFLIF